MNNKNYISEDEFRRKVGMIIKQMLTDKGMTQKELSLITGISIVSINRYIKGKATMNTYNANKIANAFGCRLSDLSPRTTEY